MISCPVCGKLGVESAEGAGGAALLCCYFCGHLWRSEPWRPQHSSFSSDPKVLKGRRPLFQALLDFVESHRGGGKLLDIGCGSGDFLALAKDNGWDVEGIESDPRAAKLAAQKDIRVHSGLAKLKKEAFDVVVLWDSLDWMGDPLDELKTIKDLLKPGGFLFVRVRNGPFHRRLWNVGKLLNLKPFQRLSTMHRHGFSSNSLSTVLEKSGFKGPRVQASPKSRGGAYGAGIITSSLGHFAVPSLLASAIKPHPKDRILHVITRLDFGGSSENVIYSAHGSIEAGRDVLVAAGPSEALTATAEQSKSNFLEVPHLARSIRPWNDLRAFWELVELFRRWQPDIVHTHSSKAGILGRWAARAYGSARIIHTPHGHVFYGYFGPLKSWFYLQLERWTARITDDLVALSEGEKKESVARGVGRPSQWSVVHSGVLIPKPIKERMPGNMVVIGCIARLEHVKGVAVLIEAASQVLADPTGRHTKFIIVGDGELMPELKVQARRLRIAESVNFAGYQNDPWSFLSRMDIYAQPSLNEGMGKTLVMAQAAGLPVAASRVCGIPDVILDEETGLLVPPSNPTALADAILRLVKDSKLRKKLGSAGMERVASNDETRHPRFSVEAMVARLEKLYDTD